MIINEWYDLSFVVGFLFTNLAILPRTAIYPVDLSQSLQSRNLILHERKVYMLNILCIVSHVIFFVRRDVTFLKKASAARASC